jgi:uncharacterized protein (TIRG00374 family)
MKSTKRPFSSNVILIVLILGLIAFVVYFYFFINPAQVLAILSKTNIAIFASAFMAYSLYAYFSALVWRDLLHHVSVNISVRKSLLYTWAGLFFEATVPQLGWSGEISKTYLLTKDSNLDAGKIGASVVGQKILTMIMTIVAMALGLGIALISYPLPFSFTFLTSLILALSILSLFVVYYVSIKPNATKTLLKWTIGIALVFRKRWNPENFSSKAQELLGQFHFGIEQLRTTPKRLVKPIVYAVISFVFEVSVIFLTFIALGYPVPVDKVLIVYTLTGTLQTVGITAFGFPEIIMSVSFIALGIPPALSFSVTLLTRVVTLWFRLIVSYVALQWAGIKIIRQSEKQ